MTQLAPVVFLLDGDNTLLDNDPQRNRLRIPLLHRTLADYRGGRPVEARWDVRLVPFSP